MSRLPDGFSYWQRADESADAYLNRLCKWAPEWTYWFPEDDVDTLEGDAKRIYKMYEKCMQSLDTTMERRLDKLQRMDQFYTDTKEGLMLRTEAAILERWVYAPDEDTDPTIIPPKPHSL